MQSRMQRSRQLKQIVCGTLSMALSATAVPLWLFALTLQGTNAGGALAAGAVVSISAAFILAISARA